MGQYHQSDSQSLADEFHDPTVFFDSRTLYNDESDTDSLFTPPFTSVVNSSESATGRIAAIEAYYIRLITPPPLSLMYTKLARAVMGISA